MTQELREEMDLAQLRGALDMSQATLAEALHVEQPAIAKLEKRTDMYVSTLRRFVEAMGGELEITARFANHNIRIRSFQELRGRTKRKVVASD
jgi:predicted transcriptional regulator